MSNSSQSALGLKMREENIRQVREALHREQIATVSHLKELTGLSIVTLNKILNVLLESGEIYRGEPSVINGGRPAATFYFNAHFKLLLIVTCYQRGGNEYAGYSVHNLFGESLERREELLSTIDTIHTDEFIIGIERYLDRYDNIAIIGLSMPSDSVGGRVGAALRHDYGSKRLAKHLETRFKIPVFFETDINAAALGCYKRLNEEYVAGIVLVPGRAPACGFCYAGAVLRGQGGMAGEVRYFPMYNDTAVLPEEQMKADDLAVRTLRAVMCVMNPGYVVVYTESLSPALADRVKKQLATPAELVLMPKIEINPKIREDIVSGMISLCLEKSMMSKSNR
ncbi:MAG: ROK family protein [Succinivibrio sp.]|nr:ROK family protein [Succinivibrio sp.]